MKLETRSAILAAARHAFSESGYHTTRVHDVISAVGMAQGSFYNYFANKRALLQAVLQDLVDELVARVEAVDYAEVVDRESYASVGWRLALNLAGFFQENRDLARIFFWESVGLDADADATLAAAYARVTDYSRRYVERGQGLGIVRDDVAAPLIAAAMVGMCAHLLRQQLGGELPEAPPEQLIESILAIHLHGILV